MANEQTLQANANSSGNTSSADASSLLKPGETLGPPVRWEPGPNDPIIHIQTSDGREFHAHADDLEEIRRRDPAVKVFNDLLKPGETLGTPVAAPPTEEQTRSRTLMNMTAAMSGQPMQNSEDEAQFEKGREAGTIAGGVQILGGAAGGLFSPGVQVAQETSSILGPEGQPVVKEVLKKAPSVVGKVLEGVKDALPKEATVEQAMKVARIVYHLGLGTGGAAFLWHEIFGK
jgi:hypothetical protein